MKMLVSDSKKKKLKKKTNEKNTNQVWKIMKSFEDDKDYKPEAFKTMNLRLKLKIPII